MKFDLVFVTLKPLILFGGGEGDRTPDLSVANAALSQLSYAPISGFSYWQFFFEMSKDN